MRNVYANGMLGAVLILLSGAASAQIYAGVALGRSDYSLNGEAATTLNLNAGLFFAPNLAADFDLVDLGKYNSFPDGSSLELGGYNFALKASMPLNPQIDIYGRLGMFLWKVDEGTLGKIDDGIDLSYGFGGSYKLQYNISAFAEFNAYNMGNLDVTVLSIGGRFNF